MQEPSPLLEALDEIANAVETTSHLLLESKGLTATVHYRGVRLPERREVERVVRGIIADDDRRFVLARGKMSWEVRPRVGWDIGKAVRWIRKRRGLEGALTCYLGDDCTDEDAFAEVGPFVTARVGAPQPTRAGHRLADTEKVAEFLRWLSRIVSFGGPPDRGGTDSAMPHSNASARDN